MNVLEVDELRVRFGRGGDAFEAVRGVSFAVRQGETLGIVGESGSGKSVTALALMGLLDPLNTDVSGTAAMDGTELLSLTGRQIRAVRGGTMSMIFQEPMTALDPVFTVGSQLVETLRTHRGLSRRAARTVALDMLDRVGIPDPKRRFKAYSHQLSGGMRQRVMIGIALCCEPRVLIADEPTTAVDVTVQAQILELIAELSEQHGTAVILITHDVGVVAETCSRVITMYAGQVVESSSVDDMLRNPRHPYSSGLLRSLPSIGTRGRQLPVIAGRVPGPGEHVGGCRFHPRCEFADERCRATEPSLGRCGERHHTRCLRANEIDLVGAMR